MRYIFVLISYLILFSSTLKAQVPPKGSPPGEILLALKQVNQLGSVLYLAAHPDDENTAVIAYFARERNLRTAYLSLTRGDGGQNLIGPEQRELMGLIRTQELLQARRIDGGLQFFTRANDFGYSKDAREAKQIWGKEAILSDVVRIIRQFRPDVVITRFPPTREAGHGHHEASAMLAIEAFEAAANPQRFPEQLKTLKTWQPKRIVWNCYSRRFGRFTNLPPDSARNISTQIPLSNYNPLLGKSNLVLASESRSMHKSQGFGAARSREERTDYLLHFAGKKAEKDVFEDIETSWKRLPNSEQIAEALQKAYQEFDLEAPHKILPQLFKAYQAMQAYDLSQSPEAPYWIKVKKAETQKLIAQCAGLWLEANSSEYMLSASDSLNLNLEMANRLDLEVKVENIEIRQSSSEEVISKVDSLPLNLKGFEELKLSFKIPRNLPISQPYWLINPPKKGLFVVENPALIGKPENDAVFTAYFDLSIEGVKLRYTRPVVHKWVQADEGELYRALTISPALMVNLEEDVLMFANDEGKSIKLTLKSGKAQLKGKLRPQLPDTWRVEPAERAFSLKQRGEELSLEFKIYPPKNAETAQLSLQYVLDQENDKQTARSWQEIEYPHIPIQVVFPEAKAKVVRLDLVQGSQRIAYIEGAGDEIPQHLEQVGYKVSILEEAELKGDLSQYEAIVVGVRAYNTVQRLKFYHDKLLDYVAQGGVLVVQYHTPWRLVVEQLGPYSFEIERGNRVTVEEAPVKFLKPNHVLLNYPNKITQKDFEDWVQERGLYFAGKRDKRYETPIASQDPNEPWLDGGILYAKHGKGVYIYTGYSFFREIPAGVPGAYRLFSNLIAKPR